MTSANRMSRFCVRGRIRAAVNITTKQLLLDTWALADVRSVLYFTSPLLPSLYSSCTQFTALLNTLCAVETHNMLHLLRAWPCYLVFKQVLILRQCHGKTFGSSKFAV